MSAPSARPARLDRLRRLALAAIVTNVGIVLTGGVVRVTGSGLGCPEWPTCDGERIVPAAAELGWHQAIEFGNRLLTFVVLAVAVAVWWEARRVAADRHDLRRLATALPVGVLAQAVLGGITVLTELHPLTVAAHFLLSMVLVAVATVLHVRTRPTRSVATGHDRPGRGLRRLAVGVAAAGAVVLVLGTLVTAAGPHAGDPGTPRLDLDIRALARLHAGAVWITFAASVALLAWARRQEARPLVAAAALLVGVELVQGAVGYSQYALGIPAELVAVHLLLAGVFWVAAVQVAALATRGCVGAQGQVAAEPDDAEPRPVAVPTAPA